MYTALKNMSLQNRVQKLHFTYPWYLILKDAGRWSLGLVGSDYNFAYAFDCVPVL